ncbi:MAG TPA: hypothetical protein VG939_05145 [Caulobacteraceae bacterium]|nr:hypothetical protein [Caulobacteraceae bacterium]
MANSYRDTPAYRSAVLLGRAQGLADAADLLKLLNGPLLNAKDRYERADAAQQVAILYEIQAELASALADVSRRLASAHEEIAEEATLLSAQVLTQH